MSGRVVYELCHHSEAYSNVVVASPRDVDIGLMPLLLRVDCKLILSLIPRSPYITHQESFTNQVVSVTSYGRIHVSRRLEVIS